MQSAVNSLKANYQQIRGVTENLCKPLAIEDYGTQSMEDVSPPKWHLAHTTWFFETFLLIPHMPDYRPFNQNFHYLFNSYYQRINKPFPRDQRGLMSRPTVKEIYAYRHYVDDHILNLVDEKKDEFNSLLELGLHHEQQHQELLLTDIKFNFSVLSHDFPTYETRSLTQSNKFHIPLHFIGIEPCITEIGCAKECFCFDNEKPRHKQIVNAFGIANRLVTNGEYAEFISANGYQDPLWWLADGWETVTKNNWQAPLYWFKAENQWQIFTLQGVKAMEPLAPVTHVSYYEADAYARFRGYRLATEFEWESFVHLQKPAMRTANFLESAHYHPRAIQEINHSNLHQFFGDVWEWTCSAYCPYPGYKAGLNALGEYNGKFMNNQIVLRGGSCVTPKSHIRVSYRNFFQPEKRWQFSGIRLAKDLSG